MFGLVPGLSLRSNPGLKLANAFGVIQTDNLSPQCNFKLMHYRGFPAPWAGLILLTTSSLTVTMKPYSPAIPILLNQE